MSALITACAPPPPLHVDQQDLGIALSPHTNVFDLSPNHSSYDFDAFPYSSSHFPHTPSYNSSYQNSPYASYSDLPPIDGADGDFGPVNGDNPSGISITVPSSGGPSILDEHYMSVAPTSPCTLRPSSTITRPPTSSHRHAQGERALRIFSPPLPFFSGDA